MAVEVINGLTFNPPQDAEISATLTYRTLIHRDKEDREFLTTPHQRGRLRFSFTASILCETDLSNLLGFHNTTRGGSFGFLYTDPVDSVARETIEGYLPGATAYSQGLLLGETDGINDTFQLYKVYAINGGAVHYRPLTRINTLTIYRNGLAISPSNFSLDFNTGVVTFNDPLFVQSCALTANVNFFVPVRFVNDSFDYELVGYDEGLGENIYNLREVEMLEIKETPTVIQTDSYSNFAMSFILDNYFDTVVSPSYETQIVEVASGYESRTPRYTDPKARYNTGDRQLCLEELLYLITFYRCTHGRSLPFNYVDVTTHKAGNTAVRFDSDLTYQFEAEDNYSTPGLLLKEFEQIPERTLTPDSYGQTTFFFGGASCPFIYPVGTFYWISCDGLAWTRVSYGLGHNGVKIEWNPGDPTSLYNLVDIDRGTSISSASRPGIYCRFIRSENLQVSYFSDLQTTLNTVDVTGVGSITIVIDSPAPAQVRITISQISFTDTLVGNSLFTNVDSL